MKQFMNCLASTPSGSAAAKSPTGLPAFLHDTYLSTS